MSTYPTQISFIQAGEPITAEVTGRPDRQLAERTTALKRQFETASVGQALIAYDVPIESSCNVGMPVYWNEDYSWFSPACIGVETGCDTGSFETSKCADVIGLVYKKLTNTTANLVLFGVIDFPEIKNYITNKGRFYLGSSLGGLTTTAPVIEVPLGSVIGPKDACDTGYYVFVNPEYARRHFNHQHFTETLKTVSTSWVSATGQTGAPTGAVYKYVIDSTSFSKMFPPIPTKAYSFEIDWNGTESVGYKTVGEDTITLNTSGIWWMSSTTTPVGTKIRLNYSRIDYANNNSIVTSLQPGTSSPITFVNCDSTTATSGDLYAGLTVPSTQTASTDYTGKAVKSFDATLQQTTTPVVNGITAGNGNITITSLNAFQKDANNYKNGLISISAKTYSADYELQPQVIKLEDSTESTWNSIPYIAFPYNRTSAITSKLEVPGAFGSNLTLYLRLLMLAPIAGTWSGLTVSYMRIPRPSAINTSTDSSSWLGFTTLSTVGVNQTVTRNGIVELKTSALSVSEGDTLIFKVTRATESSYASNIGLIRMNGILNTGD